MMNRSWRRFARCLPATFLVVTQLQPVLGAELARKPNLSVAQLKVPTTPAQPSTIQPPTKFPIPANQNMLLANPVNDNFAIEAGETVLPRFAPAAIGVAGADAAPIAAIAAAIAGTTVGVSAAVTIQIEKELGLTNIDWSDIQVGDLLHRDRPNPFATQLENKPQTSPTPTPTVANPAASTTPVAAPEPAPRAQGKYPCENFSANAPGKIPPDVSSTEEEKQQFEFANPSHPGLSAPNYFYKSGNLPDGARLARAYGGKPEEWDEHRSPGFIVNGRKVYLRWFRLHYSVLDVEYKFVADCSNCPPIITDPNNPIKGARKLNSGKLPSGELKNFKDGQYIEIKTSERVRLYRIWGGKAEAVSGYWSIDPIPESFLKDPDVIALLRQAYALPPEWKNTMAHVAVRDFPADTTMFYGIAAKQVENGKTYQGGAEQVFLDEDNRKRAEKPEPDCLEKENP